MFSKKTQRVEGSSIPFIERMGNETLSMKYDAIRFTSDMPFVVITFIQDGIEIYSWTTRVDDQSCDVTLTGIAGSVELKLSR